MPCPAPGSQLCGIPPSPPSHENSDHSPAVEGPGWALPLTAAPHLVAPSRKRDVFAPGPEGKTPHEPGERRGKSQRMPWHGPCPVPSMSKTEATRDATRVSRDEEPESSGLFSRITTVLWSSCEHPMHPKISQPLLVHPQPSRAALTEQSHHRVTLMSSTIFLAWAMVTASSSSSFSTSLRNLACWACRHRGQTPSFTSSPSGSHRAPTLSDCDLASGEGEPRVGFLFSFPATSNLQTSLLAQLENERSSLSCKGTCPAPRSPPWSQRKPNKTGIQSKPIRQ